jgi:hypothetical protein
MGNVFFARFGNPTTNNLAYASFAASSTSTVSSPSAYEQNAFIMPASCTFDSIYVSGTATAAAFLGANTLTYKLYKNEVATAITVDLSAPTTLNATNTNSATGFSVSVAAGDTVAIGLTQTNGAGSGVLSLVTVRCQ